ncbi:heterogeneous nuclear ribonucleoprotein H-like protein [Dinothrombium tinctorium]|uniref:Heterogeneous nuclear ribonucleoprotein H-like protein n=1 Tax=Dinothrombium tinctorium TaxID=1965070 RepID=A0A3S3PS77_9ACAR|nr:heterogeneous nuclear ribonucleoprotein H-like protein [Dinothrombium tinctorium]RWS07245.1 heterogeneous nuclear ribonucleoprotein H-like protein [Dinothrombium tinctorium]
MNKMSAINFTYTGCKVRGGVNGVYMTLSREGRPSGEAYVEMENEEEFKKGLDYHKKHMGSRYIEVFPSKRQEMDWMLRRSGVTPFNSDPNFDGFVRLRGLPFGCKKADIENFFAGLEIVQNGIVLPVDHQGRATGEAYVQFATREIAEKAMGKHKDKIGHRYIEIFKSSYQEYRAVWNYTYGDPYPTSPPPPPPPPPPSHHIGGPTGPHYSPPHSGSVTYPHPKMRYGISNRPSPYDRGYQRGGYGMPRGPPPPGGAFRRGSFWEDNEQYRGGRSFGGRYSYDGPHSPADGYAMARHIVHMRGLPYKATDYDIYEFFRPLQPISVRILVDEMGRASGEADVEFATHDEAAKAMNKDKAHMQHRYIELFLHSSQSPPPPAPVPPPPAPVPPPSFNDMPPPRFSSGPQPVPPPNPQPPDAGNTGIGNALGSLSLTGGLLPMSASGGPMSMRCLMNT